MRAALLTEYHADFQVDTVPDPTNTAPTDVIVKSAFEAAAGSPEFAAAVVG